MAAERVDPSGAVSLVLLSPSNFRDLVSGRRRGVVATVERGLLRLAEIPYTAAVRWRNQRFDGGRAAVERVEVPVVSVGNLTLGGTGKTPFVEWLARWFCGQGVHVALVSRGYGAKNGKSNDEALELRQKLPDVPHLQNPDRVWAARQAIAEHGSQLILLDDGFQHRRLARDLDIVLVDALEPFGFGHVFPRGTLREPLCGWSRAQLIALSRAELLSADERAKTRERVSCYAPGADWLEISHVPQTLLARDGSEQPLQSLAGKRVAAFCGLGNPAGFRHALRDCGYQVAAFWEFADHHPYQPSDVRSLHAWASEIDVEAVICTQKDLVKLEEKQIGGKPLLALRIGTQILSGQEALEARLLPLAERAKQAAR